MTFILSSIIGILIILLIISLKKIYDINIKYNTLFNDYNEWRNELSFTKNELKRCREQIRVYEKKEEKIPTIKINNKRIKKNPIYKGKRVLVGDYYEWSSENTMNILKSYGITVDIVRTGNDIIEKITHGYKCDLIFTNNIYKTGYNGVTTLNKLREIENFNIPVIVHTRSENERKYFINVCGFDEYIVKPLNQENIQPILEKFFGGR